MKLEEDAAPFLSSVQWTPATTRTATAVAWYLAVLPLAG